MKEKFSSPHILTRILRVFFYLLYNQMAWSYDLVSALVSWGRWEVWIMTVLPYLKGHRILEIGHGPGHLLVALHNKDIQVIGIDASRQMGQQARKRLIKNSFNHLLTRGEAQKLPFLENYFDHIVTTFPTEYIYSFEALLEIYRCLKPGGSLIVLPAAWITGKSLVDQSTAALFKITGQSPDWDTDWLTPFSLTGFITQYEKITRPSWSLIIISAYKPE